MFLILNPWLLCVVVYLTDLFSSRKDAKIAKKAVFYVLLNILGALCALGERRKTGTGL
jgi:hypothetical protein